MRAPEPGTLSLPAPTALMDPHPHAAASMTIPSWNKLALLNSFPQQRESEMCRSGPESRVGRCFVERASDGAPFANLDVSRRERRAYESAVIAAAHAKAQYSAMAATTIDRRGQCARGRRDRGAQGFTRALRAALVES